MFQFISHHNSVYDYAGGVRAVLEGGCRWVQLRMKDASDDEFLATAEVVAELCRRYDAKFIIDDRVHLVAATGADGVHLGKNDMPVAEARKILGEKKIIGATSNTFDDIRRAAADGADYIGLGPFRYTTTKQKLSPVLGMEGYRSIMEACRREGIELPVVAIGGITAADIPDLCATGINGIALSGAVLNASDPVEETRKITNLIKDHII